MNALPILDRGRERRRSSMHTDAVVVQLEKGMSDVLRCATKGDDGQMRLAAEERYGQCKPEKMEESRTWHESSPRSLPSAERTHSRASLFLLLLIVRASSEYPIVW